jgi:hypothetical protein
MLVSTNKNSFSVYLCAWEPDLAREAYDISRQLVASGATPLRLPYLPVYGEYDWPVTRTMIDRADAYIILTGASYGDLAPSGESYLHREVSYILTRNRPVASFMKNAAALAKDLNEAKRLMSMQNQLRHSYHKFWSGREELLIHIRAGWSHLYRLLSASELALAKNPNSGLATPEVNKVTIEFNPNAFVEILCTAKVFSHGQMTPVEKRLTLSWQKTLAAMGPMMLAPVREEKVRGALEDYLEENYRTIFLGAVKDAHAVGDVKVNRLEFQKLKAYLKSAGMVTNVASTAGGLHNYWQLTSNGEQWLNGVMQEAWRR